MASFRINIKYFNSFWLKKAIYIGGQNDSGLNDPAVNVLPTTAGVPMQGRGGWGSCFPGLPWETADYNGNNYPEFAIGFGNSEVTSIGGVDGFYDEAENWFMEAARYQCGFNNVSTDYGVKAYLKEQFNNLEYRPNGLIYSGVYNSRTGVNDTNVFSVGESITKAADPQKGSIQKLYAEDTNLIIFQEDKVNRALIDKDQLYTSEGGSQTLPPGVVIGQIVPYKGEFGISKNPESFAVYGFRKYFVDKDRGSVMRLSNDGLSEISEYGLSNFFRDKLKQVQETPNPIIVKRTFDSTVGFSTPSSSNSKYIGLEVGEGLITPKVGAQLIVNGNPLDIYVTGNQLNKAYLTDYFTASSQTLTGTANSATTTVTINSGTLLSTMVGGTITGGSPLQTKTIASVDVTNNTLVTNSAFSPKLTGDNYVISYQSLADGASLDFSSFEYDRIPATYDVYDRAYILSIQKGRDSVSDSEGEFNTLAFDENVLGWPTFYSYKPKELFSLKNTFFTTKNGQIYEHYVEGNGSNRNKFYGNASSPSSITFVFNNSANANKNFLTIGYEGSNGWQVNSFDSDQQGLLSSPNNFSNPIVAGREDVYVNYIDSSVIVKSYYEGSYDDQGNEWPSTLYQPIRRGGFDLKEGKYVSNIKNNSVSRPGEVVTGPDQFGGFITSGIKAYVATVKMSTDSSTDLGAQKQLFATYSNQVLSSQ